MVKATDQGPKRADAVKNRQRILAAAQEVFSSQGLSVPVDAVAARAGVGVGTLYRNFPTKEALFEAIVSEALHGLLEQAEACAVSSDPGQALFTFLGEFVSRAVSKQDLRDALDAAGIDFKSRFAAPVAEIQRCVDRMLQRAVAAGTVRDDVTMPEVMGLVTGACHAAEYSGLDAASCRRMVEVVCDGLHPHSSH